MGAEPRYLSSSKPFLLHHSTISKLETPEGRVSDVLRKRRHPRDLKIWSLVRLGWTQEKVGELFGLEHPAVAKINGKVEENIPIVCAQFWNKRKSADEICAFNDMDKITTWAMILDGKDGLEMLKKLVIYKRYGIDPWVNPIQNISDEIGDITATSQYKTSPTYRRIAVI